MAMPPRGAPASGAEYPDGQVLDWEVGVAVGRDDPALQGRVMRVIDHAEALQGDKRQQAL